MPLVNTPNAKQINKSGQSRFPSVFRSCRASLAARLPSLRTTYGQSTNPSAEAVLKFAQERIAGRRTSSTRSSSA